MEFLLNCAQYLALQYGQHNSNNALDDKELFLSEGRKFYDHAKALA